MTKCKGELESKESELQRLRREVSVKTLQIAHMEESLQDTRNQLDSKSDMGRTRNFIVSIVQETLISVVFIFCRDS